MSIAAQLQTLCDARVGLVAKCNLMGAPVPQDATFRMCEQALCMLAGINSLTPGSTQTSELSYLRGDLVRVARALGFTVPDAATIPDVVEILQPGEIETTAYAVAIPAEGEGMYELHFIRAVNAPTVGGSFGGKTIAYVYSGFEERTSTTISDVPWYNERESFTSVVFDGYSEPLLCAYMFYGFKNCTTFDLQLLSTRKSSNFTSMFQDCSAVTNLDLSGFDTRNAVTFLHMFYRCKLLSALDMKCWDIRNAEVLIGMFQNCAALPMLDLSTWKFGDKLRTIGSCFWACTILETIYVPPSCDMSYVSYCDNMFTYSTNVVGGNGTTFDSDHVTSDYARVDKPGQPGYFTAHRDMTGEAFAVFTSGGELVFARGQKPKPGDKYKGATVIAAYDSIENVTFTSPWQQPWNDERDDIRSVRFDGWIRPQSCAYLFAYLDDCSSIDLDGLWCPDDPDCAWMFFGCEGLSEIDLTPFDGVHPSSIDAMFAYCQHVERIYAKPGTDWSDAYDDDYAFRFCYDIVGGAGTTYDYAHVSSNRAIIDGFGEKPGYFTAK